MLEATRRAGRLAVAAVALSAAGLGCRRAPAPAPPEGQAPREAPPAAGAPLGAPPAGPITPKTEAPNEARVLSSAFSAVARAMRPSVVRIDVEVRGSRMAENDGASDDELAPFLRRFFGGEPDAPERGPGLQRGTGSGIVIDGQGNIVTNRHVVNNATRVSVTLSDGREFAAKTIGTDAETDVAVIRLDKPPADLVAARLGDSDKLEVGEWVLAVGSPLGLDQTVTAGIVSGKGRPGRHVQMSGKRVRGYIQTDAKINPGNSGGPLVNLEGEVVGVNTLIQVGAGGAYGFAIPVNEVRRVAQLLIKDGRVRYPYLGLMLTDVKDLDDQQKAKLNKPVPPAGAFVAELTPGGPAGKAGVRPGDVITEVDNQKVKGAGDVVDYVSGQSIGAKVMLHYVRDGRPAQTTVALGELPDEDRVTEGQGQAPGKIGLGLQTLTPDVASSLGLDRGTRGAVITDVLAGSPAADAGLKPGDVIVEVDRKPVSSSEEAVSALQGPQKNGHLLRVRGASGSRFVTIK